MAEGDVVESERSIAEQKTREEGKPEQAIAKIVEGRLGGFYREIVLLEQESVTESKKSVKAVLDAAGRGEDANESIKYFAPFLSSTTDLTRELAIDQKVLERFVRDGAATLDEALSLPPGTS